MVSGCYMYPTEQFSLAGELLLLVAAIDDMIDCDCDMTLWTISSYSHPYEISVPNFEKLSELESSKHDIKHIS